MFKFFNLLGSIGILTTPVLSYGINQNLSSQNISTKGIKTKHLLYSYNNKIYEDKDQILKDFLLSHPDFIKNKNVIGDINKAIIDYDQNMLNKDMLPDYSPEKISPAFLRADGQLTKNVEKAKSSYVNPAFIRERLTDGFGNYFSPKNGKTTAINSYARRIFDGKIGVIKIDNFNSTLPNYYNPLSGDDFKNLKNNTTDQIKNNPSSLVRNGYSHKWYKKENNKEIKSFDDIFDGSSAKLKKFVQISFDKYTIMKQMYSKTNGYNENQNNIRDYNKIHGKNLNAKIVGSSGKSKNRSNTSYSLVTANGLEDERVKIKNNIKKTKNSKKEFTKNKLDQPFGINNNMSHSTSLLVEKQTENHVDNRLNFNVPLGGLNYSGHHRFNDGHNFTFLFGLHVNDRYIKYVEHRQEIHSEDTDKWEHVKLNFNAKNISKNSYLHIDLVGVHITDENNSAEFSFTAVDGGTFIDKVITKLNNNTKTFDINYVTLEMFFYGEHNKNCAWYNVLPQIRPLKSATFNITDHTIQYSTIKKNMPLIIGNIFIKKTEWNNNSNEIFEIYKNKMPIKAPKNFCNSFSEYNFKNDYEQINKSNNFFSFYYPNIIFKNLKYYLKIYIKYSYNSNIKSSFQSIEVPIIIYDDYDLIIKELINKYNKIDQKNGYDIHPLLDYDKDTKKYIYNQHILNNNLNNFNDNINIQSNNNVIKMSFKQFKHFINAYDKDINNSLKSNRSYKGKTNELYIKVKFLNSGIDEVYKIPLEKIIKDSKNQQLASLMDGRKSTNDLQFVIDFSRVSLDYQANNINNINFKWEFKNNLSASIKKEYQQFIYSNKKPFEADISKIIYSSFENDALYMVLNEIKNKIINNPIWKNNSSFSKFIQNINPSNYNLKIEERLNLNDHLLWKINRNLSNNQNKNNFINIKFIAHRNKKYKLNEFLSVLDVSNYEKNKIIASIKNKHNDAFKVLISKASLLKLNDINPNDNIALLAWNYFYTLKKFINNSSLTGSLPNGNDFKFFNLDNLFIGNEKMVQKKYLVDSEYVFNGQIIDDSAITSIPKLYDDNAIGQKQLDDLKILKINTFEPPLITQLYNKDGKQVNRNRKANYDKEDITILNALWSIAPKPLKDYVFYKDYKKEVLFKINLIYSVYIPEENLTYYFLDNQSVKRFINNYIQQFIVVIDSDSQNGGENV